jgi:Kelch motif/Galactose oxidase, central domain
MKAIALVLALMAIGLPACSLSVGTIGTWSNSGLPPTNLSGATSVVLPDGTVVFLGGFDASGQPRAQVLRLDPKDSRWSQGAPMPVPQTGSAIAALSNGSVLVAGGGGAGGNEVLAGTWIYSPQLDSWSKVGDLHVARSGATAVQLADGQVLIAGGSVLLAAPNFFGFSNSAETFDPQTNSWSLVGPMHAARTAIALVALRGGRALAAGGCASATYGNLSGGVTEADVFDPATSAWTVTTPLPEARCGASGLTLRDGRALVTGGSGSNPQQGFDTNAFFYDEHKRDWSVAGSTVADASSPILLSDGRVFVAAVQSGPVKGALASFVIGGQLFDPASGDWSYATSTSVLVPFRLAVYGPGTPTLLAQSDDRAVVLIGTFGLALTFNPLGTTPPLLVLDSSGLTLVLAAFAAALCLWLAIKYMRGRLVSA